MCFLSVVAVTGQQFAFSKGLYRIGYVNGTEVTVTNDVWHHDPLGKLDIVTDAIAPGIVAAAAGWIRWIVEDNTEECHPNGNGEPCCWRLNNYVVIEHPNGEWSQYTHISAGSATAAGRFVGEWVESGTLIGIEGSVGCSTGPHLHFEVCRPPETGTAFDTIGGFLRGELLNPVICGIGTAQPYYVEGPTYTASPCDDNCANNYVVSGSLSANQEFVGRADTEISTNNVSPVVYANASSAQFRAGGSVRLRAGFHAGFGARFTALIKACNTQN